MAGYALTPATFDGTDISTATSGTYKSFFEVPDDPLRLVTRTPVEVVVPGDFAFPVSPRSQPASTILPLHVQILTPDQATLNVLKVLFSPMKGDVVLTVTSGDSKTYQLTVRTIDIVQKATNHFVVRLYVARPIFELSSESSDTRTITTTPTAWTEAQAGTVRCYPIIEVKPTAAKSHANDYLHRWQVICAWRSELAGVDSQGLGYPIDVADGNLDTAAEVTGSRMQADRDDLRVLVDGVEVDRYLDYSTPTATKVWCNISFRPMRRVTLAQAWGSGALPAAGTAFTISDPAGTLGWPDAGFMLIGSECVQYSTRTDYGFTIVARGARNTTAAAHSLGDLAYWVEHEIQIVSDYTGAVNPPASTDRTPYIDLVNSSNLLHKYPGPFANPGGNLRCGQFLQRYTNDNLLSPAISFLDSGSVAAFRDTPPSAAAPQFNNLELYVPCGVKAAASAITHDITVNDLLGLNVYGTDMAGMQALLACYNSGNDGASSTITPAAVLSRIRYNALIRTLTGANTGDSTTEEILAAYAKAQEFTLDAAAEIGAILLRLKRVGAIDGDVSLWLVDCTADNIGAALSPVITIPQASIGTGYADLVALFSAYINLPAGKYGIAMQRAGSSGNIYVSFVTASAYGKGLFFHAPNPWQKTGGTFGNDSTYGTVDWTNPSRASASDDSWATAALGAGTFSHLLKATNFGFSIPLDATIDGIRVLVEGHTASLGHSYRYVVLYRAGVLQPNTLKSFFGGTLPDPAYNLAIGTDSIVPIGVGKTDLWNQGWTPADINDAGFGCSVSVYAGSGADTASIDCIWLVIYYTDGAGTKRNTSRFAVLTRPGDALQSEAPSGSAAEVDIDNVFVTFDNTTPRTPLIVRAAQETIYWLKGVLTNVDTAQALGLSIVVPLNVTTTIDCKAHTVTRSDTGEAVPGAMTPSDLEEWLRMDPSTVHFSYAEAGVGTVTVKPRWRDAWA